MREANLHHIAVGREPDRNRWIHVRVDDASLSGSNAGGRGRTAFLHSARTFYDRRVDGGIPDEAARRGAPRRARKREGRDEAEEKLRVTESLLRAHDWLSSLDEEAVAEHARCEARKVPFSWTAFGRGPLARASFGKA
jgi:hypothetical protein